MLGAFELKGNFTDGSDIDRLYSEIETLEARFATLAEVCSSNPSGQYMDFVGTAATVRDLVSLLRFCAISYQLMASSDCIGRRIGW